MTLYIGNEKVTPILKTGEQTINNQDKTITENGTYTADIGYTGLGTVKVEVSEYPEPTGTIGITSNGIVNVKDFATADVRVPEKTFTTQEKTVTDNGVVTPDSGYDGLSKVTVNVEKGITPSGTLNISNNGTYNVTNYASAEINVPSEAPSAYIPRALDTNGKMIYPTTPEISLSCMDIGSYVMTHSFQSCSNLTSVSFPNLTNISGIYAMSYAFSDCSNLTSVSFPNLTNMSGPYAMYHAFQSCSNLTSVSFPSLTDISGPDSMYGAFQSTNLTSVSFPSLTDISGTDAMNSVFSYCYSLASVSFPELKQIGSSTLSSANNSHFNAFCSGSSKLKELNFPKLEYIYCTGSASGSYGTFYGNGNIEKMYFPKLKDITYSPAYKGTSTSYTGARNYIFANCSKLTELHFGAENEEAIKATSGYATKWGATNATIYFDL